MQSQATQFQFPMVHGRSVVRYFRSIAEFRSECRFVQFLVSSKMKCNVQKHTASNTMLYILRGSRLPPSACIRHDRSVASSIKRWSVGRPGPLRDRFLDAVTCSRLNIKSNDDSWPLLERTLTRCSPAVIEHSSILGDSGRIGAGRAPFAVERTK